MNLNGDGSRDLITSRGILLLIRVAARGRQVAVEQVLNNLGCMIALTVIGKVLCEFIGEYCCGKCCKCINYEEFKYDDHNVDDEDKNQPPRTDIEMMRA